MSDSISFLASCQSSDEQALKALLRDYTRDYTQASQLRMPAAPLNDGFLEHGIVHVIHLSSPADDNEREPEGQLVFQFMPASPTPLCDDSNDAHLTVLHVDDLDEYAEHPAQYRTLKSRGEFSQNCLSIELDLSAEEQGLTLAAVSNDSLVPSGVKGIKADELAFEHLQIARAFVECNADLLIKAWNEFQNYHQTGFDRSITLNTDGIDLVGLNIDVSDIIDSILNESLTVESSAMLG